SAWRTAAWVLAARRSATGTQSAARWRAFRTQARMSDRAKRKLVIAIDGPAGAGKSTIAAHLAQRLGYLNIETGAMYRALALQALETDISVDDGDSLVALAEQVKIELQPTPDGNRVLLDRRDVTARTRLADVTDAA